MTIEALRARMREAAEKATPGAWVGFVDKGRLVAIMPAGRPGDICTFADPPCDADAAFMLVASPANVKALDAEITRLREDMDRVTREGDGWRQKLEAAWERLDATFLHTYRMVKAEAALAKRDEEVAAIRGDAHFLLDLLMVHAPAQVTEHPDVVLLRRKIHGPEALTKEPTNAE